MNNYTPDRWVVIRIINNKDPTKDLEKVLAGWIGGYLDGDSWRLNSGNKEVLSFEDRYEFLGESGSTYVCYKNKQGLTSYTRDILKHLRRASRGSYTIKIIKQGK